MLRFLTNKLKSHSLTEDQGGAFDKKAQDDHDSGTESDDESGEPSGSESMDHEEELCTALRLRPRVCLPLVGGRGVAVTNRHNIKHTFSREEKSSVATTLVFYTAWASNHRLFKSLDLSVVHAPIFLPNSYLPAQLKTQHIDVLDKRTMFH